jgi:predicted aconitase
MYLTDDEKRILEGEKGKIARRSMEFLIEMSEVAGAERLVDLDGTADMHTPWTSLVPFYEFPIEDLRALAESGEKFKTPTFANKTPLPQCTIHDGWKNCNFPPHNERDSHERMMAREWMALYKKMGMLTVHSCDYYLATTYWPTQGQHCSWNESSAIPYCNAILGARSNIDGCFMTAYLGKAPYYGMHVPENRYATVVIDTERKILSDVEWDVLGFSVGEECGLAVPALVNTGKPTTTQILKFNTASNTGGSVAMYHIPGTTPEAPTLEYALGGRRPKREVRFDEARLRESYEKLNSHRGDSVDMVSLGCPHYGMVELMLLARKLEGRKVRIPLWIMTIPWLFDLAEREGFKQVFDDAGATLVSGTCPAALGGCPPGIRSLAVDSAKQAYYVTGCYPDEDNRLDLFYGSQDDCVEAALTGVWRGEWR